VFCNEYNFYSVFPLHVFTCPAGSRIILLLTQVALSREHELICLCERARNILYKASLSLKQFGSCLPLHRHLFSSFIFPSLTCFRRQFELKTWSLQLPKFVPLFGTRFRTSDSMEGVEVTSIIIIFVTIIESSVAPDQVVHATGQSFFPVTERDYAAAHLWPFSTPTANDSVFFTGEICLSLIKLIDGVFCVVFFDRWLSR
jgi:hypothetical protein